MGENKDLYFEIEETKERESEIKDTKEEKVVRTYSITSQYAYPYLLINIGYIPEFSIKILKNSLEDHKFIDAGTPEGYYNVYIKQDKKVLLLGLVHSDNLKTVLLNQLYKKLEKYLMIDPDTKVEGDLMFSYCTSPHY